MSSRASLIGRTWTKAPYLISTDSSLLDVDSINEVYASPEVHWASPMPKEALRAMLDNSLCFGLFQEHKEESRLEFVGIARCITDFVTFTYLTDVWVRPDQQGKGLGSWLIQCVQSVIAEMPHLRRSMLFTSDWDRSVPFYQKLMKMSVFGGFDAARERAPVAMLEYRGPGPAQRGSREDEK